MKLEDFLFCGQLTLPYLVFRIDFVNCRSLLADLYRDTMKYYGNETVYQLLEAEYTLRFSNDHGGGFVFMVRI